jgi:hypothetical protein
LLLKGGACQTHAPRRKGGKAMNRPKTGKKASFLVILSRVWGYRVIVNGATRLSAAQQERQKIPLS